MTNDHRTLFFSKWFGTAMDSSRVFETGGSGPNIWNVVEALNELGYSRLASTDMFTQELSKAISSLQEDLNHRREDGKLGPGTRWLLTETILDRKGPTFFQRLKPTFEPFYQVFLSYAHADAKRVDKLNQWLQNHRIAVIRDVYSFHAGEQLEHEVERYLHRADKTIIVHSSNSEARHWPTYERFAAERVESLRGTAFLVYLLMDGVEAPEYDKNRIHIVAENKPLESVGNALIQTIMQVKLPSKKIDIDETQPL